MLYHYRKGLELGRSKIHFLNPQEYQEIRKTLLQRNGEIHYTDCPIGF